MKPPRVQYADSPEGKIGYQVVGDGPIDLAWNGAPRGNLDALWEHPPLERYLSRLAAFSRLIIFNPRGFGVSDPIPLGGAPAIEEWVSDLIAVLDAAGSDRAALIGYETGGPHTMVSAAANPERILALVLVNCFASLNRQPDYAAGLPPAALDRWVNGLIERWGTGEGLRFLAPELAEDERFRDQFGRFERLWANPSGISVITHALATGDVRGVLSAIKAPTLVISHAECWVRPGHARYLAEHIPNSKLVERPGPWGLMWAHDVEATLDEIQAFLTGTRRPPDLDDRVLATVLFTDIVGSTRRAADAGDRRWRWLLEEHEALTRKEIDRFRGRVIKSTGDGFLATFDGPARAARCALALTEEVRSLGIELRAGLHTGEVEMQDNDVSGIAVHIAERVMAEAAPNEVLVSSSVPPLVAGSGIDFEDRGVRDLKGVPGEWRLFAIQA